MTWKILSIAYCLALSIGEVEASNVIEGTFEAEITPTAAQTPLESAAGAPASEPIPAPETLCPSPQPIAISWQQAGKEKVLEAQKSLGVPQDAVVFPDVQLQLNAYIDSQGKVVCEYRVGSAVPVMIINLNIPKKENAEERSKQNK